MTGFPSSTRDTVHMGKPRITWWSDVTWYHSCDLRWVGHLLNKEALFMDQTTGLTDWYAPVTMVAQPQLLPMLMQSWYTKESDPCMHVRSRYRDGSTFLHKCKTFVETYLKNPTNILSLYLFAIRHTQQLPHTYSTTSNCSVCLYTCSHYMQSYSVGRSHTTTQGNPYHSCTQYSKHAHTHTHTQ